MNDSPSNKPPPRLTPAALADKQAREAREAAALRVNLRRRRAQAQARREDGEVPRQLPTGNGSGRAS